ncbi:MAG: hypothetical protein ACRC33_22055, partial [Gemmataceae bacterium]
MSLWAVTTLFNPAGYRRRVENYREFRRRLRLPLAAVELSFDGSFSLTEGDADVLVRLSAGDVMWQKERLINIAPGHLPAECREVLWVDGDLVVPDPGWPARVSDALERSPLVQAFSRVEHLTPDGQAVEFSQPSLAHGVAGGESIQECMFTLSGGRHGQAFASGFAWAARRELLERHGLFDACILGGGDTAQAAAAFGRPEEAARLHAMNDRQRDHYLAWAAGWGAAVGGRVGCVDATVQHLWHGSTADRRWGVRHRGLAPFGFDPAADLAAGPGE